MFGRARLTDPDSSKRAAKRNPDRRVSIRRGIIAHLGQGPDTPRETGEALGYDLQSVTPRFQELFEDCEVVPVPRTAKNSTTKTEAQLWRLTSKSEKQALKRFMGEMRPHIPVSSILDELLLACDVDGSLWDDLPKKVRRGLTQYENRLRLQEIRETGVEEFLRKYGASR